MKLRSYILSGLTALIFLSAGKVSAQAAYPQRAYTLSNLKNLTGMVNNVDTMMLYDGILPGVPQANNHWKGNYAFKNVKATLGLKIKKDLSPRSVPETFSCDVVVAVRTWTTDQAGSMPSATNVTLKVNYDKRKGMTYNEQDLKVYNNAH